MRFSNKVCLVTGSSRGIGKAIAQRFLSEGGDVWLNSRSEDKLNSLKSDLSHQYNEKSIHYFAADCVKTQDLQDFYDAVQKQHQKLDVLVINVGDGRSNNEAIPDTEHWNKVWGINFESALQTSRMFLPMLKNPGANILFISSIVAIEAFGAPVDYSTAKAAVNAFAKNLSRKLAPDIRVNVLAPGNVFFEGGPWEQKMREDPDKVQCMLENSVPMRRFARPEEIASAAAFLCSEEASFITGSTLVVDGGQTVSGF
ncbi:MAG: SDR family NAD(P)-dependent oxidoreductase [Aestuariibacter sp.]